MVREVQTNCLVLAFGRCEHFYQCHYLVWSLSSLWNQWRGGGCDQLQPRLRPTGPARAWQREGGSSSTIWFEIVKLFRLENCKAHHLQAGIDMKSQAIKTAMGQNPVRSRVTTAKLEERQPRWRQSPRRKQNFHQGRKLSTPSGQKLSSETLAKIVRKRYCHPKRNNLRL